MIYHSQYDIRVALNPTYLIHLKSSGDGLDQDRATDGSTPHADIVLSQVKGIIPQPGLKMRLHLGQVEVWPSPALNKLLCVVEEVQSKVEQATRDGLAINGKVLLLQMPTSSAGDKCG
jgi:hypothetical protein